MNLLQRTTIVIVLMCSQHSFAQIPKYIFNEVSGEEYSSSDFTPANTLVQGRFGVYHFGESEGEWDLVILKDGDGIIIQAWNGTWAKDYYTKTDCWRHLCKTFNKVTLSGNKIVFGNHAGMFVDYKQDGKKMYALLLFGDLIGGVNYKKDTASVGVYNQSIAAYYDDKRYALSTTVQPESYFNSKSKQELKIMRNTIYANYGLFFQPGGDMENYFRKKSWYSPFLKDVSALLTDIEKKNIATIARLEK